MSVPDSSEKDLQELVQRIVDFALDRKATDIRVIDLTEVSTFTDAFIICGGGTDRQVKAIHDAIHEGMKAHADRRLPLRNEGLREGRWVLMDYGEVVVHILVPEARELYALEQLWGDQPDIPVKLPEPSTFSGVGEEDSPESPSPSDPPAWI